MSELHRLFWEAAMLDNDTYRDYLDQCRSSKGLSKIKLSERWHC